MCLFLCLFMGKTVVMKELEARELMDSARIKFLTDNPGVRATDEAVVVAALKMYCGGVDERS